MSSDELIHLTASAAVALLRRGEVSPFDLLDALERRIAAVDPAINALPTLCFDRSRDDARALLEKPVGRRGLLAGLPMPIKDVAAVARVRTTYGSPIYADHVPDRSDVLVERLEGAGAIVYAKSNTPEFAAGGHTFNEVFGVTRNPWNTGRSPGGSSGGAAAALAAGMAWLGQGSDFGGSLRLPAAFCGVVGLRPSPGLVARDQGPLAFQPLSVSGPMARNVPDLALALAAMVGADARDPMSFDAAPNPFTAAARRPAAPKRAAFSPDLGLTPVDPAIAAVCAGAAARLAAAGMAIDQATPDLGAAPACFHVLRAAHYAASRRAELERHRDQLKPEVVWNIEQGLKLSAADIAAAEAQRAATCAAMAAFQADYDLLITPAAIVPPFPVDQRYVERCGDHRFDTYMDWLTITYALTITGRPVLALPCGLTGDGLPVGLQLVGRHRGEVALLRHAAWAEQALALDLRLPISPRAPARSA